MQDDTHDCTSDTPERVPWWDHYSRHRTAPSQTPREEYRGLGCHKRLVLIIIGLFQQSCSEVVQLHSCENLWMEATLRVHTSAYWLIQFVVSAYKSNPSREMIISIKSKTWTRKQTEATIRFSKRGKYSRLGDWRAFYVHSLVNLSNQKQVFNFWGGKGQSMEKIFSWNQSFSLLVWRSSSRTLCLHWFVVLKMFSEVLILTIFFGTIVILISSLLFGDTKGYWDFVLSEGASNILRHGIFDNIKGVFKTVLVDPIMYVFSLEVEACCNSHFYFLMIDILFNSVSGKRTMNTFLPKCTPYQEFFFISFLYPFLLYIHSQGVLCVLGYHGGSHFIHLHLPIFQLQHFCIDRVDLPLRLRCPELLHSVLLRSRCCHRKESKIVFSNSHDDLLVWKICIPMITSFIILLRSVPLATYILFPSPSLVVP